VTAVGLIVPSCGAACLSECLRAVARLDPGPAETVIVLSGPAYDRGLPAGVSAIRSRRQLGFAAAVNAGISGLQADLEHVALLNDDAIPASAWLAPLLEEVEGNPTVGAVQSTVSDAAGGIVDGRGIVFDPWGLPVQLDRGDLVGEAPSDPRTLIAVSGTAALLRRSALERASLPNGVFDPAFHSYHEDLDLGLRLLRTGWSARWVPGPATRHLGSTTGGRRRWRHPWWVLANRWRALAGNLTPGALLADFPRLLRGEIRAVRTLTRHNPRSPAVAVATLLALPVVLIRGWRRRTPGPRLMALPEVGP